jgi:hypothetical protein
MTSFYLKEGLSVSTLDFILILLLFVIINDQIMFHKKKITSIEELKEFLRFMAERVGKAPIEEKNGWTRVNNCIYKAKNMEPGSYKHYILRTLATQHPHLIEGHVVSQNFKLCQN